MDRYDAERPCAKCGFDKTTDQFVGKRHIPWTSPEGDEKGYDILEHIRRACLRCGFVWNEEPLS